MIICGIKLTHDGAVALIDDQQLVCCIEMEKLDNAPRYMHFNIEMDRLEQLLQQYGYSFNSIDRLVLDGWAPEEQITINLGKGNFPIKLAGYGSMVMRENILERQCFDMPGFSGLSYASYQHVAGHIAGAYCTSPFANQQEDAFVLIWDGGMYPQLFYFHHKTGSVENLGVLFMLIGNIYSIFSQHFGPYKVKEGVVNDQLSVAGKVMAYIALGELKPELLPVFRSIYDAPGQKNMQFANSFSKAFLQQVQGRNYRDEDILHTFHVFLEQLLVEKLTAKIKRYPGRQPNLCFAGGCALNIKWNSAIRNTGLFKEVWVPPFPNDSGSALGTACCEMISAGTNYALDWNVYSGPAAINNGTDAKWIAQETTVQELAQLLFEKNEPVVFLNGAAELGPRALGNRSILAPATDAAMKGVLNKIKSRESYRPVAPICLEEDAPDIFEPGIRDPYMLFDHKVRPAWKDRIPAVCHLDGTARLQTVNSTDNPVIYELLMAYKQLSGIPLLCNTSANLNGRGFFPDAASAMAWNEVNYVWCNNRLYEKTEKHSFQLLSPTYNTSI